MELNSSPLKVYVPALLLIIITAALLMNAIVGTPKSSAAGAELYCLVLPDIEAREGGVLKVKIVGSGLERIVDLQESTDGNTINITLTFEVSYDGPGKVVIRSPNRLVGCTANAASTMLSPRIVSTATGGDALNLSVEPGRPARYNVTLTLIFTGASLPGLINVGTVGERILGYEPGVGYQELYRGESLKVIADLVGISWG